MAQMRESTVVDRSLEEVFAYLSNPQNDPEWSSASNEVIQIEPDEPVRRGTRFRQLGSFLGRRLEFVLEVTVYEDNHRFGMKVVSGPIRFAGVRTVERKDDRPSDLHRRGKLPRSLQGGRRTSSLDGSPSTPT